MPFHFHDWVHLCLLMYLVLIGNKEKGKKFGECFCGGGGPLGVS
jgi:hypothetical protein